MAVLQDQYKILSDWKGKKYLGLDLDWDHNNRTVHLSMLGYVAEPLTIFLQKKNRTPQDQPYLHINPNYGVKVQYDEATDNSPPLSKEHKKVVHEVTVNLLYYARSVDPTMLTALGSITDQQANPTEQTMQKSNQLLDYAASHPDAVLTYQASEMDLAGHSNALYLSQKSPVAEQVDISLCQTTQRFHATMEQCSRFSKIIKAVMSSAAEAELGAIFINCKEAIPARQELEEMGHKHTPKSMQSDNTTAQGVFTNRISSKSLKSMDMRLHWLRFRATQGQFCHYWRAGETNLEDYITKHHA